jgi:uncharacterized protein YegL
VTSTVPLILSQEPVTRGMLARMKISKPNIAVVYADAFGGVASFAGRPLSWSQQVLSRYRTRYEVDLSDHRRNAQLDSSPLPSLGDVYFFRSMVDVGFKVTNPEAVVRRNVIDALPVVYNYLIDAFRPVTRQHRISDSAGAEAQLNLLFEAPHELEEGITIYRCTTRLQPDTAAQSYLRSLTEADRTLNLGTAQHEVAKAAAHANAEIAAIQQDARLEAEHKELDATAGRPVGIHALIQTHLAKHPDQTDYALEVLQRYELAQAAQRDVNDQRALDLARYMMEQGLIQSVDVELLRRDTLHRVQQVTAPGQRSELTASSWDAPLPGDADPILSLPAPQAGPASVPGVTRPFPVYLAIDESPADDDYLDTLNKGVKTLLSDLARHPEVISAVRLAVLGYAADVQVRMPLNAIVADTFIPPLTPRAGASLAAVLDDLRDRISDDVSRLKDRGLTVGRPTVYILSAAASRYNTAWDAALRRLINRATFPYAPNILAFGIGAAPPEVIISIAEKPQSRGWVALPGMSLSEAAESYTAYVRESIINLGRAHVSGRQDTDMPPPQRFRPVGDRN